MKPIKILVALIAVVLFTACGSTKNGIYESVGGKEDVAYLFFQSQSTYANKVVDVTIDGKTFKANVAKDKKQKAKYKGVNYAIKPGTHHISISFDGKTLLDKTLVIGTQETKTINL